MSHKGRNPSHELPRDARTRRVLLAVLGLNLLVALTKFVVARRTGSLSLLADALHSLLDGTSNVVGLIGLAFASAPPDPEHPYGHRRFETLASIAIGMLIAAGAWEIVSQLYERLATDSPPPVLTWTSASFVAATVLINLGIHRYETREGRALSSPILLADAKHTLTDTFGALVVLVSFGATAVGFEAADLIATIIIALLILRTAYQVIAPNLRVLVDAAPLAERDIHSVALSVPGVVSAHKIRSRGTPSEVHVDLHVQLNPEMPLADAHDIAHQVGDAIRHAFPNVHDVLIHTEPAKPAAESGT